MHLRFRSNRSNYFQSIRRAKETHWNNFLENSQGKDIFTAFRFTKPRKIEHTPPLNNVTTGETTTTFEEKANLYRTALFPPLLISPPRNIRMQGDRIPWKDLTDDEIKRAIMTSSANKAPGPDGINFKCIQQAYLAIPHHFTQFYKATMSAGYHPHIWREATIVIIKKPNKPDYSIPKAYRPVSLLNCLGKVLEKIMASRLAYLAERYGLLH